MPALSTTIIPSPLGSIRIKGSNDFISEIHFQNIEEEIISSGLEVGIHPIVRECSKQLSAYFAGSLSTFSIPVKQEGSEFQQSVWAELLKIPCGKTISYLELSKRIGDVKAIRAVGTSNGKNKIAIIVPCHRVIGTNGSLTGYAGGLGRKQWLLEHEMKVAHGVLTLF